MKNSMEFKERLEIAKRNANANCYGTALFLSEIVDQDSIINKNWLEVFTLVKLKRDYPIQEISCAEEGALVALAPAVGRLGEEAGIIHMGIITSDNSLGLDSYIDIELARQSQASYYKISPCSPNMIHRAGLHGSLCFDNLDFFLRNCGYAFNMPIRFFKKK